MGKCDFEITKGKKKQTKCGIYTSKMIGKKYYCAAHFKKMNENNEESSEEVVESKKKKIIKKPVGSPANLRSRDKEKKIEKKTKKEYSDSEDELEDSLSEVEPEPKKEKKKYEPYKPSEQDLEEKDIEDLLDEAIEHEKEKPDDIKLMEKVDLLINKVAKIKRMIKQRKTPSKKSTTTIEDDLEMEIFN